MTLSHPSKTVTVIAVEVCRGGRVRRLQRRVGQCDAVERQETVWQIAGRYTADEKNIRSLVEAIIEVNALSPDGAIRAGQRLRVPVLKGETGPQLAHR